jgi:hypothetical protein
MAGLPRCARDDRLIQPVGPLTVLIIMDRNESVHRRLL